MISNYEIKKVNGQETLYIYLDNNYEFAKIHNKNDKRKLKQKILDFIKENEITFAGSTVALVAGGLVIGNVFLNKSDDINLKNSIISINLNPDNSITEVAKEEFLEQTSFKEDVKEEIKEETNMVNEAVKKETLKSTKKTTTEVTNQEVEPKEEIENNQMVTVFRSNGTVLNLELEDYLVNVVAAEMPASFHLDALKAQAVLARTYALKAIKNGRTLTDTVSTQVYKDNNELKKTWGSDFNKYYNKIKEAVNSTEGETLKYNGDYIEAVYHSTSNGYTEDASNVWKNSYPYLKTVESSYDKNVKNYEVINFYSYEKLSNLLGFQINAETEFIIESKNVSERVSKVTIGSNSHTGVELRTILNLRSADFEFEKVENGINIKTRGYGHGVGMSQYGSNEMAKAGYNYKDILKHYYNGTSLEKS